ncbi:MAG: IclR family transcriptional regulator [Geminicoccaceae bacterium]
MEHSISDDTKPQNIPTIFRALAIIEEAARVGEPATPTALNERLDLPKPTIHRLCAVLESAGYLTRDLDGRRYSPGERLRGLALGVLSSSSLQAERRALLSRLSEQIGETCNLAIPDGDAMLYLERVETKWPLRIQLPIGTRVPLHCTASGKMYLSTIADKDRVVRLTEPFEAKTPRSIRTAEDLMVELEKIRERGYSTDAEEFTEGMIAVAVPVFGPNGHLAATLSFHAPTQRLSLDKACAFVPVLKSMAGGMAALMS